MTVTILKTAGLCILAVLLIILLLLICPIFYEAEGSKYEKLTASARLKLLFIFAVGVDYEKDKLDIYLSIFGKKFKFGGKKKKEDTGEKPEKPPEPESNEPQKPVIPEAVHTPAMTAKAPEDRAGSPENEDRQETGVFDMQAEYWQETEAPDIPAEVRKISIPKPEIEPAAEERPEVRIIKLAEEPEEKDNEKKEQENKEDKERPDEKLDLNYFLKMPAAEKKELFKAVIKLIKSLLKGVLPRDFYIEGKIGMSDPALTGQIVGIGWTLAGILNKKIHLEAVFDREVIEGKFGIKGHIIPVLMLFYIIRFLAAKPVWRIIKLFIKGDKNGK